MMSQGQMGMMDQTGGMITMMVEQAKLSDDMFETYGVDEEEFNHAMLTFNVMNDPEVAKKVKENMMKLGMGGGMGGMGGMQ